MLYLLGPMEMILNIFGANKIRKHVFLRTSGHSMFYAAIDLDGCNNYKNAPTCRSTCTNVYYMAETNNAH